MPYHGKVLKSAIDSKIKQNSCAPCYRVTANLLFNFGLLAVASILNILFKFDVFGILHITDATNGTINNGSSIQGVQDQNTFLFWV